jgi:GNAT superfamily N-acetyltransferase
LKIRLEPLGRQHDRAAFSCGNSAIDGFFHSIAMQRQEKGLASTMVAIDADGDPNCIIGFYCFIQHQFRGAELPDPWRRSTKAGSLNFVPGALLAQLGVSVAFQGQGIGKTLVREVFRRAIALIDVVGCVAIVADPIGTVAASLYAGFQFQPLGDGSPRMIVAMKTVAAALAALAPPRGDGGASVRGLEDFADRGDARIP